MTNRLTVPIGNNQAVGVNSPDLQIVAKRQFLFLVPCFVLQQLFCHLVNGVVFHLIGFAIRHAERQDAIHLLQLTHFTSLVLDIYGMKAQHTFMIIFQVSQVVIATSPDAIILVAIERGDTCDAWRVDDVPVGLVVIEQAFEVGYIDNTVFGCIDVIVDIMRLIVLRRIVFEQRQSLRRGRKRE